MNLNIRKYEKQGNMKNCYEMSSQVKFVYLVQIHCKEKIITVAWPHLIPCCQKGDEDILYQVLAQVLKWWQVIYQFQRISMFILCKCKTNNFFTKRMMQCFSIRGMFIMLFI